MNQVSAFYTGPGQLLAAISSALDAAGVDRTSLQPADLAAVDEFHIRGRRATLEIMEALALTPDFHVLDLGSGLGGPARTLAELSGCTVTGIDLTPEFCQVATALSEWTGLSDLTSFQVGDATATGLPDGSVDAAITVHVAMNIPDKHALYAEAFRVLRPGGTFVVYDVLQGEGGEVHYPVPWADDSSTSFPSTLEDMRGLPPGGGFQCRLGGRLVGRKPCLVPAHACQNPAGGATTGDFRDLPWRQLRADDGESGGEPRRATHPDRHVCLLETGLTGCKPLKCSHRLLRSAPQSLAEQPLQFLRLPVRQRGKLVQLRRVQCGAGLRVHLPPLRSGHDDLGAPVLLSLRPFHQAAALQVVYKCHHLAGVQAEEVRQFPLRWLKPTAGQRQDGEGTLPQAEVRQCLVVQQRAGSVQLGEQQAHIAANPGCRKAGGLNFGAQGGHHNSGVKNNR